MKNYIYIILFALVTACSSAPQRTPSQSDEFSKEQLQLAEDFLQRWSEPKIPDFLEEKKADYGEVMYPVRYDDPKNLMEILASDTSGDRRKTSTLIDSDFFSSLQHQTNTKRLIDILKQGELRPFASPTHNSEFGIYLELHSYSHPKHFEWGEVELHFNESLLDRKDYHLNNSWDYGAYGPYSASPAVNLSRLNFFVETLMKKDVTQNEFVFHKPISTKSLKKIVVVKGTKSSLIKSLSQLKIKCPSPDGWEKFIEERAKPKNKVVKKFEGEK